MKKPKIKAITNRDQELFKQLSRTGLITREQAVNYLKYDNNFKRLTNLVKDGYLKEQTVMQGKERVIVYKLDRAGRTYVERNVPEISYFYNQAGFNHDHKLTELYYEKYYDYRDTWRTEQEYKQEGSKGCPDGSVRIGSQTIAVEVVTSNYTAEHIQSKLDFAEEHGMEVEKYYA